jgi:NDP-sugar pyrophosphorylase family protein
VVALSPVCILAGGFGTRLGDAVSETPKPLLPVGGRPFLFHQLELLKQFGAQRVVICTGYLGELIQEAIGDGSRFGLTVDYSEDGPIAIGTAGAVRKAASLLGNRFLVLYGDTYLRIDYAAVDTAARDSGCPALMTVLRNEGRWDTSNAGFDGSLVKYDKHNPDPSMAYIDYGLSVLTDEALARTDANDSDLAALFSALARDGLLAGYEATERFYEIGTPHSLAEASAFLARLS